MNTLLNEFTENTLKSLDYIRKNGVKEHTFNIKCLDLKNYLTVDICDSEQYKVLFDELKKITGPSLYWFEIVSETDNKNIIDALQSYNQLENHRNTPVFHKNYSRETRILYVGKVKKGFWGRVIQHLGYFTTPSTQGLQLYHWVMPLDLELMLHVIEFESDMADVMPVVEQFFSLRLKPLIGKHI